LRKCLFERKALKYWKKKKDWLRGHVEEQEDRNSEKRRQGGGQS
jgi:hypothetical protein